MKISFVTFGRIAAGADGRATSDAASARYRVLIPGEQLAHQGHVVEVHSVDDAFWKERRFAHIGGDAVVFSKSFDARNEQLARALRQQGRKVLFDICDNHFHDARLGPHYLQMAALADELVVATQTMAEAVAQATGRTSVVIGDPVEGARCAPRFAPAVSHVDALWFGHPVNLDPLFAVLPELAKVGERRELRLELVTKLVPGLAEHLAEWNRQFHGALKLSLTPWSLATLAQRLERCDVVLIPSFETHKKNVKSPNRLVETIWAGRLAIAYPLPSYMEFASFARIDKDVPAALLAALESPHEYTERIASGQRHISATLLPAQIAARWGAVLKGVLSSGL